MHSPTTYALVIAAGLVTAPAMAQRVPFEKSFEAAGVTVLDASTIRGKIEITVGGGDRIVVGGAVTVRLGLDVPVNAEQLAQKIANAPPIERDRNTVRLRPPSDPTERRAVTVNYQVRVPPDLEILAVSDSGAIMVQRIVGAVHVRTQSGAIELRQLGNMVTATTGSGSVLIDGAAGSVAITTSSSAFTGRAIGGNLRVRTASGAVDASLSGSGDVDVETGSSAIRLRGVRGALTAASRSGRIAVEGQPDRSWNASTGPGSIEIAVANAALALDATSRSGSVRIQGANVNGPVSKRSIKGVVGAGGPPVRLATRSGSVLVAIGPLTKHAGS